MNSLLSYQSEGVSWLLEHPRAILADEMGLGKTVQAIGIINHVLDSVAWPEIAIVAPASLAHNWRYELGAWTKRFYPISIAGESSRLLGGGIRIVSYEQIKTLGSKRFDLLIVDEAHMAKDYRGTRFRQLCTLADNSERVYLLTGTPMPNGRPVEIWSLLAILNYQNLRNKEKFRTFADRYCKPKRIEFWVTVNGKKQKEKHWNYDGADNLDQLAQRLRATVMLRREKAEVLAELPPKRRQWVELGSAEEEDELTKSIPESWDSADAWLQQTTWGGRPRFDEYAERRHAEAIKKAPLAVRFLREALGDVATARKVVVFAHHTDVLDVLFEGLDVYGAVAIDGRVDVDERHRRVHHFQKNNHVKVCVAGLTAAGIGLTLTASSWVVFVEEAWAPWVVSQAEDRCHRIGQSNSVLVQHLVRPGTLDAKMTRIMLNKQRNIEEGLKRYG